MPPLSPAPHQCGTGPHFLCPFWSCERCLGHGAISQEAGLAWEHFLLDCCQRHQLITSVHSFEFLLTRGTFLHPSSLPASSIPTPSPIPSLESDTHSLLSFFDLSLTSLGSQASTNCPRSTPQQSPSPPKIRIQQLQPSRHTADTTQRPPTTACIHIRPKSVLHLTCIH